MSAGLLWQALLIFVVTNVDDLVILALFFGRGADHRGSTARIATGQYLGFTLILVVAVAGAWGATLLPAAALPYLGLLPLILGLKAAWEARRGTDTDGDAPSIGPSGPTVFEVTAVTFANGGDNVGVYVPIFATAGVAETGVYVVTFLVLVAGCLAAGRYLATRPVVARALVRWGHVLLPVVLIGLGAAILVEGGAFGL
ncbi:cadmium resistance transporter [Mycolicibacterium sp. 050158]|uniref:cadmium resistance transporter n=1 Tax=Mycolicibacterium sp. 050158 TaxID=3090602 RepID=UPI00299E0219|nr:cadmium resistance transporter [Mycolicibacterium sp. 050158]MDX1891985.1 cadmium resistance transporter [Mycolicibacterium sp. 050158]